MARWIRPTRGLTALTAVVGLSGMSVLGLSGCGGAENASSSTASSLETETAPETASSVGGPAPAATRPSVPVAAIASEGERSDDEPPIPAPEKGTPEWMLREITRIRTELPSASGGATPRNDQARAQHEKIIELARLTIAATHQDPQRIQLFNNAVHYLSDSRLALAIHGDTEQARLLVADADSLYRRDRTSFSAIESSYKVVQLAERHAEQQGRENPEWLTEFANQARLFAERFPHEPNRSALVLLSAGQLCDREGMIDAAKACFTFVQKQFPDTIFAEQVHGFLRRYSLIGQPLELAGPTIEGGYVAIDDFHGHPVLVTFWAATSPQFQEECDRLEEVVGQFSDQGLRVIGVNLDIDEAEVDRFLSEHVLSWPHIFHSDLEKRGGRHPLARYYGVQRVPTYWLVDRNGTVVAAPADSEEVALRLPELLSGK